jgi:hypothetical protein
MALKLRRKMSCLRTLVLMCVAINPVVLISTITLIIPLNVRSTSNANPGVRKRFLTPGKQFTNTEKYVMCARWTPVAFLVKMTAEAEAV